MTAKLLIVDDDINTIRLLSGILRGEGELFFATSGASAITVAHEKKPDIVLLDAEMPGMDGFEVCAVLKADPVTSGTTIIFVTAHNDIESEMRALDLGAIDFIHKPINLHVVHSKVHNHIILKMQPAVPACLHQDLARLTPRERDVLSLLRQGKANKEIAHQLEIEDVTVRLHLKAIFRKLGVKNRVQAVARAIDLGMPPSSIAAD
ncbi:MAG: response regulator transcription factor [Alphaproteobacteria bacterium]|nr:response regulator transcription factor [Alphaproteobacteria bacterium]